MSVQNLIKKLRHLSTAHQLLYAHGQDIEKICEAIEILLEANKEVIRNSHDIAARKNCSRSIEEADKIAGGKDESASVD